jgi:transcriptional regulator of acetoin/glycerol metabolism
MPAVAVQRPVNTQETASAPESRLGSRYEVTVQGSGLRRPSKAAQSAAGTHKTRMPGPDQWLRESLHSTLSGSGPVVDVRPEVLSSWARAAAMSLAPDALAVPYSGDVEVESRLMHAAMPVVDRLASDLAGTETALVVSDNQGTVVHRRVFSMGLEPKLDRVMLAPGFSFGEEHVGTNGIGTALAERKAVFVVGGEHFADAFVGTACAGAPVTDPHNGQLMGVIDLSTSTEGAHSLMLALVKRAAWEVEQRLLDGSAAAERVLYRHFLAARRRAKRPLVVVGEHTTLANTAASRLLGPADGDRLWEWALRALTASGTRTATAVLASGTATVAECDPVYDAQTLIGAVLRLRPETGGAPRAQPAAPSSGRPLSGWESLTQTERSVALLVAEGYTNRETAARLFLSWHTVDSHLRHVYAKLGIVSRVQLARMTTDQSEMDLAG